MGKAYPLVVIDAALASVIYRADLMLPLIRDLPAA